MTRMSYVDMSMSYEQVCNICNEYNIMNKLMNIPNIIYIQDSYYSYIFRNIIQDYLWGL